MIMTEENLFKWLKSLNIDHSYKERKEYLGYNLSSLANYELYMVSPIDLKLKWNVRNNGKAVTSLYISSNNKYILIEYVMTKKNILLKSNLVNFYQKNIRISSVIKELEDYLIYTNPQYFKNIKRNIKIDKLLNFR